MTNTNTNTVRWQYNYCNVNGLYQDWVGIHSPEPVLPTDGWLITGSVGVDVILEELGLVPEKKRPSNLNLYNGISMDRKFDM